MNAQRRRLITDALVRISEDINPPVAREHSGFKFFVRDGWAVELRGVDLDDYRLMLDQLAADHTWQDRFSDKYLEGKVQQLIVDACNVQDAAARSRLVDLLVDDLRAYHVEHCVYVPLVGLGGLKRPRPFGPVRLIPMTPSARRALTRRLNAIIRQTTSSEQVKNSAIDQHRGILSDLSGLVLAEFRVVAEPLKARELALLAVSKALDILRYSSGLIYHKGDRVSVATLESALPGMRTTIILASDDSQFTMPMERIGPLRSFEFNGEVTAKMKRIGAFKIANLMIQPEKELNQIERSVLRGVHWFADSQLQRDRSNALLSLIVCLEALMPPAESGNTITTAIAEGITILCTRGVTERRRWKARVKELYVLRSKIAHGSGTEVAVRDILDAEQIAGTVIMRLLKHPAGISTHKEFAAWVEGQKLR